MLEIFTFGGLCIRLDGEVINNIRLRKAEALLVYLAVNDRPIQRELLADLLWPEYSQAKAMTSLRTALAVLHKKFGDYFDITHECVQLNQNLPYYLDFRDLEQKCSAGQIDAALNCFTGDFLAGFHVLDSSAFEGWQFSEQLRIREVLISTLHESLSIAIDTRDFTYGLTLAHELLDLDMLDEYAHQGCILLHALNGDRVAALIHYQKCVEILQGELGIEPQEETQTLFELIARGETPCLRDAIGHKHNLPESTTSFVGRRYELFQIKRMLKDDLTRLVTLVGPGGCGKTRLALEAARLTLGTFPDGTFFVPFDESYSAEMIVPAIARAINFSIDTFATRLDPEKQLIDYLSRRVVLLVLDSFEGLTTGAALLGRLLEKVQGLKIMVTSRQRLNLQREWPYLVGGLLSSKEGLEDLPLPQVESARLFTERALQVNHGYHPSERDYQSILRICQMVEGMPLAIELAAVWIGVMTIDDIEKELSINLDFLSSNYLDVPEKHHSIRIVFENTWDLLTGEQQNLLCKLSIFENSFNQQAAAEVVQVEINQLLLLVEKSLVYCDHHGRFSIHNLIRMFAYEKLTQKPAFLADVREKYCRYYLGLLTTHEPDMNSEKMEDIRLVLRQETYHLQKAAQWAIQMWDQETMHRILTSTLVFYAVYAWFEGVDAFRLLGNLKVAALTRENDPNPENNPMVLCCRTYQAFLLTNLGQIEESERISQSCLEALEALGLKAEYSVCLHNLGANASFRGEYEIGTEFLEQAVIIGSDSEFILWPTYLLWLGHGYLMMGEYEAGLTSLQKSQELFMRNNTLWGAAFAISKMGLAYDGMGDHLKALEYHQEALSIFEKFGNIAGKGYSLSRMSMSACFTNNYHLAIRYGEEAYQLFDDIGHSWGLASTLPRLGFAYLGLGEVKNAFALFLRGVNLSQKSDMAPLSLYSLAGIAFTMLETGPPEVGIDLLSFVLVHPKTPMAFINQPLGTLDPSVRAKLKKKSNSLRKEGLSETIGEVLERYQSVMTA